MQFHGFYKNHLEEYLFSLYIENSIKQKRKIINL